MVDKWQKRNRVLTVDLPGKMIFNEYRPSARRMENLGRLKQKMGNCQPSFHFIP
jgi:hypothetical protein